MKLFKRVTKNMWLLYTALFIVVFLISILPFGLRGNSFVSETDGFNQGFPIFIYTQSYIRNLLSGNITLFDFRLGLGDDVISCLSCSGVYDVIQVLIALIVPKQFPEFAYGLCTMIKFYLSGIAFLIYIKRYVTNKKFCIAGALLYTINVFALRWGMFLMTTFLAPMITLPLILAGIDKIFEKDFKVSGCMIAALFLQGMNGFYFLYMEIITAVIYCLVVAIFRLYGRYHLSFKQIVIKILCVALNGIIGVGLSCVILLPAIIGLLNSSRGVGSGSHALFIGLKSFLKSFGDLLMPNVYSSITTLSVVTVGGSVLYFCYRKGKKEFKYLSLGLWILFWCPAMGSVMNGFSYSTDRWFFVIVFFANVAAILAMEEQIYMSVCMRYVFWLLAAISIVMHVIFGDKGSGMLIRIAVFGACCLCFPYLWNYRKNRERNLLVFCIMLAVLTGLFSYGPKILGGSGYSAGFKENGVYAEIEKSVEGLQEEQYEFERYDIYDSSLSASLVMDYFGTTEYFSVLNSYVSEFYQNINISPGVRAASHILRGLDGRRELEALLSVSQYMDFETDEVGGTFSKILSNKDYLPLGFTYDNYLVRSEFEKLNSIEKQSLLLNAVVLEEEQAITEAIKIESSVNRDQEINFQILGNHKENKMRVYIDFDLYSQFKDGIGEIYVQFCDLSGSADIFVGNKDFQLRDETFLYYLGQDEFWINLSELKEDEQGLYFDLYIDGKSDFSQSKMHVWWHEIDHAALSKRSQNTVSNLELGNNSVKGKITCEADEILFFSIPFSSGWKAYVDGKETEIKRADIAFMAILPGEGEHEILLKYESPGMKLGLIISMCMVLTCAVIFLLWKVKTR